MLRRRLERLLNWHPDGVGGEGNEDRGYDLTMMWHAPTSDGEAKNEEPKAGRRTKGELDNGGDDGGVVRFEDA